MENLNELLKNAGFRTNEISEKKRDGIPYNVVYDVVKSGNTLGLPDWCIEEIKKRSKDLFCNLLSTSDVKKTIRRNLRQNWQNADHPETVKAQYFAILKKIADKTASAVVKK